MGMKAGMSPSVWRVWIEIVFVSYNSWFKLSPSVWRVWIEIGADPQKPIRRAVTLRVEGVD